MDQQIIEPIDTALIEAELTPERFLRHSNKGGTELYTVTAHNSPNTMREIGRLREIAFRSAGGGTGKEYDIDEFDTMEVPCTQLIVWDPESKQILGGYRYICGRDIAIDANGHPRIATAHIFNFSERFLKDYLPYTLELGRSFVRLEYQSSRSGAKALFTLDNLWDGLGSLTVLNPEIKYLFGKVTMYPSFKSECRDMILLPAQTFSRPRQSGTTHKSAKDTIRLHAARGYVHRQQLQGRLQNPECRNTRTGA